MLDIRRRLMMKPKGQPLGTIWYWTTDGEEAAYYSTYEMVSHGYGAKGVIKATPAYKRTLGQWLRGSATVEKVQLPEGVLIIEVWAFRGCTSLRTINLPESLTSNSTGANFEGCTNLTIETIHLPNLTGLARFGINLHTKHITSLGRITTLPGSAFNGYTELEDVVLPDSLETLGVWAFRGCTSLTEITLPSRLTSFGNGAQFQGCSALREVTVLNSTAFSIPGNVFQGCTALAHIYVPAAAVEDYKAASGWSSFASIISAIPE